MAISKSTRDVYCAEGIALYKQIDPTAGYLMVENGVFGYLSEANVRNMLVEFKRRKIGFYPTALTPLSSKLISYVTGTAWNKLPGTTKRGMIVTDRTGAFKLEFSDGSFFILVKYFIGQPKDFAVASMLIGAQDTFYKFNKCMTQYHKNTSKPKNGIFTAKIDQFGRIIYNKLNKIQHTPVVHQSVDLVTKDMDHYFSHVSDFTRYGMSGVRKVLLVGPPGTGKSSYAYQVAARHKEVKSIIFASDVSAVAQHLTKCCKLGVPTIIIWEDAESTGLKNAGSDILNFLDGIDQPQTKYGAYIMMTTNFPEMIDKRIKKRPGRVDKIFEFGVLNDMFALECAQIYFDGFFPYTTPPMTDEAKEHFQKLGNIVTGMTGAEIKGLAYSAKLYAAGNNRDITLELIQEVKDGIAADLANVDKYGEAPEEKPKSVGFAAKTRKTHAVLVWETPSTASSYGL